MIILLLSLLLCLSAHITEAQTPVARFETRLRSLEQRVANLEAAQRNNRTPNQNQASAVAPVTTAASPRTTEEIERVNIQATSPQARLTGEGTLGGPTGTGSAGGAA